MAGAPLETASIGSAAFGGALTCTRALLKKVVHSDTVADFSVLLRDVQGAIWQNGFETRTVRFLVCHVSVTQAVISLARSPIRLGGANMSWHR